VSLDDTIPLCWGVPSCITQFITQVTSFSPFFRPSSYLYTRTHERNYTFVIIVLCMMELLWILYMFFWVFPRRQFVVCWRFGTMCQFHLQRLEVDCHSLLQASEDGTDTWFRNVGKLQIDTREVPKRTYTIFKSRRKLEILWIHLFSTSLIRNGRIKWNMYVIVHVRIYHACIGTLVLAVCNGNVG
jgi:hypothetical protein